MSVHNYFNKISTELEIVYGCFILIISVVFIVFMVFGIKKIQKSIRKTNQCLKILPFSYFPEERVPLLRAFLAD